MLKAPLLVAEALPHALSTPSTAAAPASSSASTSGPPHASPPSPELPSSSSLQVFPSRCEEAAPHLAPFFLLKSPKLHSPTHVHALHLAHALSPLSFYAEASNSLLSSSSSSSSSAPSSSSSSSSPTFSILFDDKAGMWRPHQTALQSHLRVLFSPPGTADAPRRMVGGLFFLLEFAVMATNDNPLLDSSCFLPASEKLDMLLDRLVLSLSLREQHGDEPALICKDVQLSPLLSVVSPSDPASSSPSSTTPTSTSTPSFFLSSSPLDDQPLSRSAHTPTAAAAVPHHFLASAYLPLHFVASSFSLELRLSRSGCLIGFKVVPFGAPLPLPLAGAVLSTPTMREKMFLSSTFHAELLRLAASSSHPADLRGCAVELLGGLLACSQQRTRKLLKSLKDARTQLLCDLILTNISSGHRSSTLAVLRFLNHLLSSDSSLGPALATELFPGPFLAAFDRCTSSTAVANLFFLLRTFPAPLLQKVELCLQLLTRLGDVIYRHRSARDNLLGAYFGLPALACAAELFCPRHASREIREALSAQRCPELPPASPSCLDFPLDPEPKAFLTMPEALADAESLGRPMTYRWNVGLSSAFSANSSSADSSGMKYLDTQLGVASHCYLQLPQNSSIGSVLLHTTCADKLSIGRILIIGYADALSSDGVLLFSSDTCFLHSHQRAVPPTPTSHTF
ncbi:MAG: hypothetical protein Q8P67_23585, partial [archaeon]|nr:hypothetical protein [archaeon]